ncbi:uncharacterized protein L201_000596 [Kwoniella dendrophila CBS 6074]|uniref:Prenylcysteine lyase domain-containing protein n=1 Tax=Kwoniella dendrophila CBS 6074 TaxID=1295534 RepID=A0AAX4JMH9_9TREE
MNSILKKIRDAPFRIKIITVSVLLVLSILLVQPFQIRHPTIPFLFNQDNEVDITASGPYSASNNGGNSEQKARRVAIIGAGASGSSAAFFLKRASRVAESRLGLKEGSLLDEVVVFDKEGYIGGRTTIVYPYNDTSLRPQEIGATLFVGSNKNMMKSVKFFNLTLVEPDINDARVGIWDGTRFLSTTSSSTWFTSVKALWRYGYSPMKTKSVVTKMVNKMLKLYDSTYLSERGPVESVEDLVENIGLGHEYTSRTGQDLAKNVIGVNKNWLGEIWEGATRTNYASDMEHIHGLGAVVSLATTGASQVEGGNRQIFEGMLAESKAIVHLGTEVSEIIPLRSKDSLQYIIKSNKTELNDGNPFDAVFFAAPWHSSPIHNKNELENQFLKPIPPTPYIRLQVTLFSTIKSRPEPSFFGLPEGSEVPSVIMTTGITSREKKGIPPPRFQSISWHNPITISKDGTKAEMEYIVKVFSLTRINDRFIKELIGEKPNWLIRKEWDSYPKLKPIKTYPPTQPLKGFHYLAAQEPWISTMETQTISTREAVAKSVIEWWGIGLGECEDGDSWDWTCS